MNTEKQLQILEILQSEYYKLVGSDLCCLKKGEYRPMSGTVLPSGYVQYVISNHRRGDKNISIRVYKHCVIYIGTYGVYPESWEIDHIDRDNTNCHPSNLRTVPKPVNHANKKERTTGYCERPIRGKEIDNIKLLMQQNLSQSEIARRLDLNRLSVRYIVNNIKEGKPLKYEGYYPA